MSTIEIINAINISWDALLRASFALFAPMNCAATTAPPVASAAKTFIISVIIMSTSETPEIASSPRPDIITVSQNPTDIARNCSMTSGNISFLSALLLKSGLSARGVATASI